MMKDYKHLDCDRFATVDVFKGLCRLHKEMKLADEACCKKFRPVKKCKFCAHYVPSDKYLGTCMGVTDVYPDLIAKTCKDFKWHNER
jgi:4-hydroxyphenylacetate decarboxylase small subunit